MKSKKKMLLALGAMSAAAIGAGATSTFAWYTADVAAKAGAAAVTDYITTTVGAPSEQSVTVNFVIGTVTSPELSDDDGKTYYVVGTTAYEKENNGANQIGQYAIKASMSAADIAIWADANTQKSYTVNLSAAVVANSVNVKLLADDATSGANVVSGHSVKFTISAAGAVTINQIESTNVSATTTVNGASDTSYYTNAKALFAVRPRYDGHTGTIASSDAVGPYTSAFFAMDTPAAA